MLHTSSYHFHLQTPTLSLPNPCQAISLLPSTMVLHIKAPLLQFLDTSSRKFSLYHPILSGLPGDPLLRLPELSFFPTLKAQVIPISHILLTDLLSLLIFKYEHGQSPLCSHHGATVWGIQETLDNWIHKWKCCLLFWEIADFPSLIPLYFLALF